VALSVGPLDTILCEFNNHQLTTDINVVKTASETEVVAGTSVTYSYAVTNPGEASLSAVSVTDNKCAPVTFAGGDTDSDGLLDHGETWNYTCTSVINVDTINVATATGQPPVGAAVTDTDDADVNVVNPLLRIVKAGPAQAHEGDLVTYTFTVTNTGDVTLTGLVVRDDVLGLIGGIDSLAAGASTQLSQTYTIPAGQIGDVVNTATVCTGDNAPGTDEESDPLCDGDIHVLDVLHPSITVDKTANPLTIDGSGDVTFSYKVTNTGDVALSNVKVVDDILGQIATIGALAVGESKTVTKTVAVNTLSPTVNIGTVSGQDPLGRNVTDNDDAVIKVNPVVVAAAEVPEVLGETLVAPAPVVAPEQTLPRTGSEPRNLVFLGLVLLLTGLVVKFGFTGRRA
jgi:LPXTG-motif cell wall-anchored protein